MADIPSISSGSVGSRFVSQADLDSAKQQRDAEWKAAYARLGQEPPPRPEEDADYDGRSLYERLQSQKTAKQEEWDEKMKLSNQFRSLEEDEIVFLDAVQEDKRSKERKLKDQEAEELLKFRE
ncbi:hypothetical protein BOTBODRAFT_101804 [Botryobasidium botryosum FD-172 SS1]|uniref:FAM192A/Fyv6 N-terminal domain-containing protein n=1 Tax=Botryobasidium botryosum (strain FD-172 SS1) TaxID=930990 RepID=A0A067N746_BOTB1|nr:hypothetical protein BOTBODRAFT_101804 [Botryobasidium botryosum FD-172 SS1]